MHTITLEKLTLDQLGAIADGLMEANQFKLAAQLYKVALRDAPADKRTSLQMRLGLATTPNNRTPMMFEMFKTLGAVSNVFVGDGIATWLKTMPFMEDQRFLALAEKHAGLLPLPNWHWNLQTVLWAVSQTKGLDGELVELGVFKGHTTLFTAEYVDFGTWPKRWYLYDTFEGIPDDQLDPGWAGPNQKAYVGTFSHEEVTQRFAHIPNIEVIKGRVPEILVENCPEKIAFLHIDLNNSTAEIQALDLLFERVVPGGMIVFDDYGWASARAQHNAENAWFAARGMKILPLPTGQGLFVKQ